MSETLTPIFPEHTFSATIKYIFSNFVLIKDIKLLVSECKCNEKYGRKFTLIARDKLWADIPSYTSDTKTCLIKIKNNIYFDVYMYIQNTDLLKSIVNYNWFPKLYDICFYNLNSLEINFVRELFNAVYERNNYNFK
jgi:hypothetical protein